MVYVTLNAAAMLAHSLPSGPSLAGDVLTAPRSYGKMYDQSLSVLAQPRSYDDNSSYPSMRAGISDVDKQCLDS